MEIKPCPFCGSILVNVIEAEMSFRERVACCDNCGARAPEVIIQTMGPGNPLIWEEQARCDALAEWNKRV